MATTTIKLSLGNDVRRIGLSELTFAQLGELIKSLFGQTLSGPFSIKYLDDEKELISLSSELELQEAFRQAHNTNSILKITIIPTAQNSQEAPKSEPAKNENQSKCGRKSWCNRSSNAQGSQCQQSRRCWWSGRCAESNGAKETQCQQSSQQSAQQSACQQRPCGWWGRRACSWRTQSQQTDNGTSNEGSCQRSCRKRCGQQSAAPSPVSTNVNPARVTPASPTAPPVDTEVKVVGENQNSTQLLYPDLSNVVIKVSEKKEEKPYEDKLKQLADMGFTNRAQNIELLIKRNGNVLQVVKDIVDP